MPARATDTPGKIGQPNPGLRPTCVCRTPAPSGRASPDRRTSPRRVPRLSLAPALLPPAGAARGVRGPRALTQALRGAE